MTYRAVNGWRIEITRSEDGRWVATSPDEPMLVVMGRDITRLLTQRIPEAIREINQFNGLQARA